MYILSFNAKADGAKYIDFLRESNLPKGIN